MGEASTGQRRGRLRGPRQWIPLLCRAGETAADLRFTGAGAHRPAVSEMAEANSLAVASGGSAGRGYDWDLSVWQMEVSLTQIFDRPLRGREFFEEIIRDNLDLGRPDR